MNSFRVAGVFLFFSVSLWAAAQDMFLQGGGDASREPALAVPAFHADLPPAPGNWMRFQTEALSCVVGNNEAGPDGHHKGYNGLWSLCPAGAETNFIDAGFSGLNLEHYFNGWDPDMDKEHMSIRYDPRYSGMEFQRVSETQCVLHQPPTRHFGVESWTTFTLTPPRYLDITFRCIPRKPMFPLDWLGVFWATYANAPGAKRIFFWGYETPDQEEPGWVGRSGGMYYSRTAQVPLRFQGAMRGHAMSQTAPERWAKPFYYGIWRDYVYILMFESEHDVGFYAGDKDSGWNPWDFQMIIRHPRVDAEYHLRMRLVFDRFKDRDDVLAEYEKWRQEQAASRN